MFEQLYSLLESHFDEMVGIRRHLHENPELSFEEVSTPAFIADYHRSIGTEVRENVGGRGVVATLKGHKAGPTVALRADFDALPIEDLKDVPYRSKVPGVMHACGHDGHTATLLVLAKVLTQFKEELAGTVVFIHQHAEELAPGGAIAMIEDGCLDGVDMIYGTHLWSTTPYGKIQFTTGAIMAAADRFTIKVNGKGGHGAQPHLTKDAVVIGSSIVQSLQQIVSRKVDPMDPAVLSIGSFEAKNAFNVIADSAELEGTVRTFSESVQKLIEKSMEEVISGIEKLNEIEIDFNYYPGYPAVINDERSGRIVEKVALEIPGILEVEESKPQMGGEDFGYYLQKIPGAFFFTGAENPSWEISYPHHHPRFDIDERSMLLAAKTLGSLVIYTFEKNEKEALS